MEHDEMQATDKAEIVNRYRNLLTDFWKTDSRFSTQALATEEKKKSETNSAKNDYDSTDQSLLHRKNSDVDRIHTEEASIRNSAEEKRSQISESARAAKDALNEIALSHFVSLSDGRNTQIESDIDLVRALDGFVSKARRSANNIKNEIENYKEWKETHSKIVLASVIAVTLLFLSVLVLGKREWDIRKNYNLGKQLYQQQIYFGAIEKFQYLNNNKSLINGDGYYQEIAPLLRKSYYAVAKPFMEKEEWENLNDFLKRMDDNEYKVELINYKTEYINETNYQRGFQAMEKKEWSRAILYFDSVDKNYKSTAKFLQECNWRLGRGKAPMTTAQPEKITSTENKRPFRDKPAILSFEEAKTMLANYGFYHNEWNNNGKGVTHRYKPETIAGDEVVHDEASGLMWQQSCSPNGMLYAKVKKYIDDLNVKKFAGYSDWRLPTLEEAMSLVEPKKNASGMHIDPKFDSTNWNIWTSDTTSEDAAWAVRFDSGGCYLFNAAPFFAYAYSVRAVR